MNKFGIFMNFWENTWGADHLKYIEKAAKIGFDVLEFQAQPLLEMSDEKLKSLRALADEVGIELTYSLGLDRAYDVSSPDEKVRLPIGAEDRTEQRLRLCSTANDSWHE